jgi:hypothetical protein
MLQLCQNLFTDTVLVEFGLDCSDYIVYNGSIDGGLIESSTLPDCLLKTSCVVQLTTILFDIMSSPQREIEEEEWPPYKAPGERILKLR